MRYKRVETDSDKPKRLTLYVTAGGYVAFDHENSTIILDYIDTLDRKPSDSRLCYRYLRETEVALFGLDLEELSSRYGCQINCI